MEISKHWKEPKVAIWYYMGTDNEFHYFRFIDLGVKQDYRVRRDELEIDKIYPLSKKQNEWRVMPWGPQAIMKIKIWGQ